MSSGGASSAPADAPLPPASASAAASAAQSSLRPRSPTLTPASDDGSVADSRRVRARVDDAGSRMEAAAAAAVTAGAQSDHQRVASLCTLAKVELQLIMRCCDRVSLITLARCSRSTLAAASSDFAWRCLSPIRVCSSTPQLAHTLSTSLLRHVDVSLWVARESNGSAFLAPAGFDNSSISEAEVDALAAVPRLRSLICTHQAIDPQQRNRLLSLPACANLTELRTDENSTLTSALLLTLPNRLPLLRSFSLYLFHTTKAQDLAPLSRLQHLTELRADSIHPALNLSALARCRSLRTLSLSGDFHAWPTLLSAPTLQSLRTLELRFSVLAPSNDADWSAAFANLSALEHLQLAYCRCTEQLLLLVAQHCCSLRTLSMRMCVDSPFDKATAVPENDRRRLELAALRQSLLQLPALLLTLQLDSCIIFSSSPEPLRLGQNPRWDEAHAGFTQLTREFPSRVDFSVCD